MRPHPMPRRLLLSCALLSLLLTGAPGDAADPPKTGGDAADKKAEAAPKPPDGWRERFDAVYRLRDDEVVKLVPPPFIPERADYYRFVFARNPNANLATAGQFMFWWDGRSLKPWSLSSGKGTIGSAMADCGGLERYDMEINVERKFQEIEGDWIVRKSAPREKRLAALREILRKRLGREIRIEKRKVEREVVAVSGELPKELPGGDTVHIYTDPHDLRDEPSGGGSGTLTRLFETVGGALDRKFVDETAPGSAARQVVWHWHPSGSGVEGDDNKVKLLLANLSRQTGLTFTRRTAEVEVWTLSDDGAEKTGL